MAEIMINFVEAGICWYLFYRILGGKEHYWYRQMLGGILLALAITWIDKLYFYPLLRLVSVTALQIVYSYICFPGRRLGKLLCGCTYMLIALTSEHIVFRITDLLFQSSLRRLLEPNAGRYCMVVLYLIICFIAALGLIRLIKNQYVLPVKAQLLLFAMVLLILAFLDQLANMTITISSLEVYEDIAIMTDIAYMLIIIFAIVTLNIMIWFAKVCQEKNNLLVKQHWDASRIKELEAAQDAVAALRAWRHDIRNHVQMVIGFLESGHVDRALSYIRDSSGVEDYTSLLTNSGNLALDNVLSAGFMKAKRHGIQINYTIKCCGIFPMSDTDISSLFGNLLDNAIEATLHLPNANERYIEITVERVDQMFRIIVENSCDGIYNFDGDALKSRKTELGHGLGLARIIQIVEHAGGFYRLKPKETYFEIMIVIPIKGGTVEDALHTGCNRGE